MLLKKGLKEGRKRGGLEFRDGGSFRHRGLMEEVGKLRRALVGLPGGMGNQYWKALKRPLPFFNQK